MSIRFGNLVIAQEKSKIKAGEGKKEGVYKFFTSSNIQTKYVDFFQYDKPALIFGTGGIPSVHYCDEPFSTSTDCIVFYSNSNDYNLKSLYLFFESHMQLLEDGFHGAGLQHISKKYILDIQVPDVSIDKQTTINSIGNKLNKLTAIKKQQLKNYDNLVKSRFIEMFGDPFINPMKWKKIKIEDAVTIEPQNGMYKPQSDYVMDGLGTPILRIDGFYDGKVTDFSSLKRLCCEDKEKHKYLLKEDDIVINRVNSLEYLGKCAHITGLLEETVYESNMMRMHFDSERFNSVYVTHLLCSDFVYNQIVNHAKKAVNQASINQKDVLDFDIYQPPIEFQNQFADFIVDIDKSKFECSITIKLLKSFDFFKHFQF